MSGKAKQYLLLLAALLAVAVFAGYQFFMQYRLLQQTNEEKAAQYQQLDAVEKANADKQKEIDETVTDDWVVRKGHEIGVVLPGEIKIVDQNK